MPYYPWTLELSRLSAKHYHFTQWAPLCVPGYSQNTRNPDLPSETKIEIKHLKKNWDNLGKTKEARQVCSSSCHSWTGGQFWIKGFLFCFSWYFENLFVVRDHYGCFPFWFITFGWTKSFYISKFGTIGIMLSGEYRPSM